MFVESMFHVRQNRPTETLTGYEAFGWDCRYHPQFISPALQSLDITEIDPQFSKKAKENLEFFENGDNVRFLNKDAFDHLKDHKYDYIILDAPLAIYGGTEYHSGKYCEHFEILAESLKALNPEGGAITFNVVAEPYGCDNPKIKPWMDRRQEFYGMDPTSLDMSEISNFYSTYIDIVGKTLVDYQMVPRLLKSNGDRMTWFYMTVYVE